MSSSSVLEAFVHRLPQAANTVTSALGLVIQRITSSGSETPVYFPYRNTTGSVYAAPVISPVHPSWVGQLLTEVERFADLPGDWCDYGAAPPNGVALHATRDLLISCSEIELRPLRVSPSVEEGVTATFHNKNSSKRAAIELSNTGRITAVISDGTSLPSSWSVGSDEVPETLDRISAFLNA
jgi:hypothetical protein